jgi:hypothetical protein
VTPAVRAFRAPADRRIEIAAPSLSKPLRQRTRVRRRHRGARDEDTVPRHGRRASLFGEKRRLGLSRVDDDTKDRTRPFAASAGDPARMPPAAAKRASALSETSYPTTSNPDLMSVCAMPKPIAPRPTTATLPISKCVIQSSQGAGIRLQVED